jgi:hypothetical protein
MQSSCLGLVKDRYGTGARRDHSAVGKANPLVSILLEELIADGPVFRLIFTPIGMNLPGDLGRQLVDNAFQEAPLMRSDSFYRHSTSHMEPASLSRQIKIKVCVVQQQ